MKKEKQYWDSNKCSNWVVITFRPDGTYGTCTYDNPQHALNDYETSLRVSHLVNNSRNKYALILEGSYLPIEGYEPGVSAKLG